MCNAFQLTVDAATCESEYSGTGGTGPYLAQLFQKMTLATGDMQAFCYYELGYCDVPPVIEIDESQWFSPKPANRTTAPAPSGAKALRSPRRVQALTKSQERPCKYCTSRTGISIRGTLLCCCFHTQSLTVPFRFDIASEANCSQDLCCRPDNTNTILHTTVDNASVPASRFGEFLCDTTADLGLSAFDSMHQFLNLSSIPFSLFTGDLISHDPDDQQSRAYVSYEETVSYHTFEAQLPNIVSRLPSTLV